RRGRLRSTRFPKRPATLRTGGPRIVPSAVVPLIRRLNLWFFLRLGARSVSEAAFGRQQLSFSHQQLAKTNPKVIRSQTRASLLMQVKIGLARGHALRYIAPKADNLLN